MGFPYFPVAMLHKRPLLDSRLVLLPVQGDTALQPILALSFRRPYIHPYIKGLLRSFLDFSISYGLDLGKQSTSNIRNILK